MLIVSLAQFNVPPVVSSCEVSVLSEDIFWELLIDKPVLTDSRLEGIKDESAGEVKSGFGKMTALRISGYKARSRLDFI